MFLYFSQMKEKVQSYYPILFFLLCCFCWFAIVMSLGVYSSTIIPKNGVLPFTFNWWESTDFQNHLMLGNYLENETAKGTVYTTYTYPFYLVNYLILAPFHHLFGLSYEIAHNILPYINVCFFALVLYRIKKSQIVLIVKSGNLYFLLMLLLIVGLLISNALPWISMLKNNLENFHMLVAILFCVLSLVCLKEYETKKRDRMFLWIGLLISFLTPIYFPAWLLCYVYSEDVLKVRKSMVINIVLVVFSNFANYILPVLASESLNLQSSASGFLYRSGLDGSRQYFDSILSVIYAPSSSQEKTSTFLLIIATIVLGKMLKSHSKKFFKQAIFLLIPFLSTIILFPQFSSIHMYFVELLLVIPCVFMLCYWLLNFEIIVQLQPKQFSLLLVFFTLLIMSQLLELAAHFALLHEIKTLLQ